MATQRSSDKSRGIATALAAVFGYFGVHRFYVGKIGTGILMAITGGGFGLWYAYDVIIVATGNFRDADGFRLISWEGSESRTGQVLNDEVIEELDALRADMSEIQERLDFTERLLTKGSSGPMEDTEDSYPAARR
jgi:hypothetical protein